MAVAPRGEFRATANVVAPVATRPPSQTSHRQGLPRLDRRGAEQVRHPTTIAAACLLAAAHLVGHQGTGRGRGTATRGMPPALEIPSPRPTATVRVGDCHERNRQRPARKVRTSSRASHRGRLRPAAASRQAARCERPVERTSTNLRVAASSRGLRRFVAQAQESEPARAARGQTSTEPLTTSAPGVEGASGGRPVRSEKARATSRRIPRAHPRRLSPELSRRPCGHATRDAAAAPNLRDRRLSARLRERPGSRAMAESAHPERPLGAREHPQAFSAVLSALRRVAVRTIALSQTATPILARIPGEAT